MTSLQTKLSLRDRLMDLREAYLLSETPYRETINGFNVHIIRLFVPYVTRRLRTIIHEVLFAYEMEFVK